MRRQLVRVERVFELSKLEVHHQSDGVLPEVEAGFRHDEVLLERTRDDGEDGEGEEDKNDGAEPDVLVV